MRSLFFGYLGSAAVPIALLPLLLLLSSKLSLRSIEASTISFTAGGQWVPAQGAECDRFLCTPNNLTWRGDYPSVLYDSDTACRALRDKGACGLRE